jgi:hypothetical protein
MIVYPSITKFAAFVELKDFRGPTKKEYVRYVRRLGDHYQCDPATLTEDHKGEFFTLNTLNAGLNGHGRMKAEGRRAKGCQKLSLCQKPNHPPPPHETQALSSDPRTPNHPAEAGTLNGGGVTLPSPVP